MAAYHHAAPHMNGHGYSVAVQHRRGPEAATNGTAEPHVATCEGAPAEAGAQVSAVRAAKLAGDPLLQQAKEALAGARTLAAHRAVVALCEQEGVQYAALLAHSAALGIDLALLDDQVAVIREVLATLPDERGFTCAVKSEPRVLHRKERGSSVQTVKYFADVAGSLERVLCLCVEYDLAKMWQSSIVMEAHVMHTALRRETFYGAIWTPLLVFDTLTEGYAHDLGEEERCLMITLQDAAEPLPPGSKPMPLGAAKRRRGSCLRGTAILLEALPPGPDGPATRVRIVARLDPRLPFVPGFLIAFVLKVAAPYIYRQVQAVLDLFNVEGSYLRERLTQRAAVYERVRRRCSALLEHFYGSSGPAQ